MATKYTAVDVDEGNESSGQLEFHDIPHSISVEEEIDTSTISSAKKVQTHTFTKFPHPDDSDDEEGDKADLLTGEKKAPSFWTFEYYQNFFDVDTYQVLRRILGSIIPNPRTSFLEHHIRPNPDMYGPFWICTTLVFTTAIAGNMANYFQQSGYIHSTTKNFTWHYDFHKVTFAASAVFSYWWVIPTLLWALLWWRGSRAGYTYLEIICVYGYSLAIYIPISILFVIPYNWLHWLLVLVGMLLSGTVLLFTFWPAVRDDDKKIAFIVMGFIMIFHGLLATGFVLYFFHVPAVPMSPIGQNTTALPSGLKGQGPTQTGIVQKVPHNVIMSSANRLLNDGDPTQKSALSGQQPLQRNSYPQQNSPLPKKAPEMQNVLPPAQSNLQPNQKALPQTTPVPQPQNQGPGLGQPNPGPQQNPLTNQGQQNPSANQGQQSPLANQGQQNPLTNQGPSHNNYGSSHANAHAQNPDNIPPAPQDNTTRGSIPSKIKRMADDKRTDIVNDVHFDLSNAVKSAGKDMTAAAS